MSAKQKYQKITEDWASRAQDANYSDFTLSFMPTVGDVESYDKMIGQKRARSEVDDMVDAAEPLKKKTKRKTITFHCDDRRKKDKGYLPFPLIVDNIKSTNNSLTVRQCRAYCAVLGLGCRNGTHRIFYNTAILVPSILYLDDGKMTEESPPERRWSTSETTTPPNEGEQLRMIKARTMYKMVEEIPSLSGAPPAKLLFITNKQANLLAGNASSLQRMMNALEIPRPKLVINLLCSWTYWTEPNNTLFGASDSANLPGAVKSKPPFLSLDEKETAEAKVDRFMQTIIIPLAVKTQAIIICSASSCNCMLSQSLTRMYAMQRAKWGLKAPFTILSFASFTGLFYLDEKESAYWTHVRRHSTAWQNRDTTIRSCVIKKYGVDGELPKLNKSHDLDPHGTNFIVVDCINSTKNVCDDRTSYTRLLTELVRHLASQLPSLCIKTSFAAKEPEVGKATMISGLAFALNAIQSGTPLLFLDLRNRLPPLNSNSSQPLTRSELIEFAKKQHGDYCDELLKLGMTETLDTCAISYFHDVLKGDGNAMTTEFGKDSDGRTSHGVQRIHLVPLHTAIELANDQTRDSSNNARIRAATPEQIEEVSKWLTNRHFADAFQIRSDYKSLVDAGETFQSTYKGRVFAHDMMTKVFFNSNNFHHLNLSDMSGGKRLVQHLVKMDRLPKENSLEALLLLREAWNNYDVVMLLGEQNKCRSKFLFALQLIVGWLIVVGATLNGRVLSLIESFEPNYSNESSIRIDITIEESLQHIVFALAISASLLTTLQSGFDSKGRWRHLRSTGSTLQSMIWSFRTRSGPFATSIDVNRRVPNAAEMTFCASLKSWSHELLSGGTMVVSTLEKKYSASIYKHNQYNGEFSNSKAKDDFYSPVQPQKYVDLRILPTMEFYQKRLPVYSRRRLMCRAFLLLCSVATAVLSHYNGASFVVAVAAAAAAMVSWTEYSDVERKMVRYTKSVRALKELMYWWMSLGEVEKASLEVIDHLLQSSEAIINNETISWVSTGKKNKGGDENEQKGLEEKLNHSDTDHGLTSKRQKGGLRNRTTVTPVNH